MGAYCEESVPVRSGPSRQKPGIKNTTLGNKIIPILHLVPFCESFPIVGNFRRVLFLLRRAPKRNENLDSTLLR